MRYNLTAPTDPYDKLAQRIRGLGQEIAELQLPRAGTAWGAVAYAAVTSDQTTITSVTDITSLTVTWTAAAGRRYRVSAKVEVTATAADGAYVLSITNASNTAVQRATDACLTTSSRSVSVSVIETPSAGSVTRKLRLQKSGGSGSLTMSAAATQPAFILVEDIGPA